ncbi:MAG: hypothetical protein HRT89_16890 [Lentisphaeria bacterium]|nr:hypothetical protein [Lentisphaeria bacterium]NQZ69737.1 hypothetical protein [Lentisphaeria bacterium]
MYKDIDPKQRMSEKLLGTLSSSSAIHSTFTANAPEPRVCEKGRFFYVVKRFFAVKAVKRPAAEGKANGNARERSGNLGSLHSALTAFWHHLESSMCFSHTPAGLVPRQEVNNV